MLTFPLTLLLYVLQSLTLSEFVYANAVNDLPLVLIEEEKKLEYPNKLAKTVFEADRGFTGETIFAQDTNTNQVFFCPPDEKKRKKYLVGSSFLNNLGDYYSNHRIGPQCLFETTFKPNEVIACSEEPVPGIYKYQVGHFFDETGHVFVTKYDKTCGRDKKGTRYKFAYELCLEINKWDRFKNALNPKLSEEERYIYKIMNMFLITQTVYEICYNVASKETLHTKHELPAIHLLQDQNLSHERGKKFDKIDDDGYNNGAFNFKKDIKFYNEELPPWYKKQLLVPTDDMMTALLRKTTNHYINIKPMHEEIIELWNFIENFLRNNLAEPSIPYEIYTGAFKISIESIRTRIPDFWIKVVFRRDKEDFELSQSVAIVLRNEYKEGKEYNDTIMTDFCAEDACQILKENDDVKAKFSKLFGHMRCCPVNRKIKNLFEENLNEGVLLPLFNYYS